MTHLGEPKYRIGDIVKAGEDAPERRVRAVSWDSDGTVYTLDDGTSSVDQDIIPVLIRGDVHRCPACGQEFGDSQ